MFSEASYPFFSSAVLPAAKRYLNSHTVVFPLQIPPVERDPFQILTFFFHLGINCPRQLYTKLQLFPEICGW
jgi:hypothetical protein